MIVKRPIEYSPLMTQDSHPRLNYNLCSARQGMSFNHFSTKLYLQNFTAASKSAIKPPKRIPILEKVPTHPFLHPGKMLSLESKVLIGKIESLQPELYANSRCSLVGVKKFRSIYRSGYLVD